MNYKKISQCSTILGVELQTYIKGKKGKRQAGKELVVRIGGEQIGEYNRLLMLTLLRRYLALILLMISLIMIAWASIPYQRDTLIQTLTPEMMQMEVADSRLSIPTHEVRLEWPTKMRIGDDAVISLSFEPAELNQDASAFPAGDIDPYGDYNLMAEGRYDVAGMIVDPAIPRRESLPAGQTVKFTWMISTNQKGVYDGTLWLSIRYLPLDGRPAIQVPVYIHEIKIEATSLFGLNEISANILGVLGLLISVVLLVPDLLVFAHNRIGKNLKKRGVLKNT